MSTSVVELRFVQRTDSRAEGLTLNHNRETIPEPLKGRISQKEWLDTWDNVSAFLTKEKRELWLKEGRRDGIDITVVGEDAWEKLLRVEQAKYQAKHVKVTLSWRDTHASTAERRGSARSIPDGLRFKATAATLVDMPGQSDPVAMDAVADC